MLVDLHQLDRKYEGLKVRNRREESRLLASLESDGQRFPIVVVASDSETTPFVIIDGFKRVRVAARLGMDQLECSVWEHSEADALMLMHSLQRPRERSALEDAYLIQVLHEEHGMSQTVIAGRLGRTQSWVSRRLALVKELPEWLQEHIRKGEVSCHVATRYLVPMARTMKEHAKLLATQLAGMDVTTRDVADIYYAWKNGTEEERLTVVTRPDLVLAARRASQPSGDTGDVDAVLQDLAMTASLLGRSYRRMTQLAGVTLEPWVVDSLRLRKRRVWEAMSLLDNRLMEVFDENLGSRDEETHSAVARPGDEAPAHRPAGTSFSPDGKKGHREPERGAESAGQNEHAR